ncbi:hypothetical protein OQA88_7483 [Cercophora sp. LCS_1]
MVPLGIITAMTAAIRVQGPSIARAFIGCARENVASAEIELMSSTSNEVCELFNGKGIVRAMGRASIKQILVFPSVYWQDKDREDDKPAPFLTNLKGTWNPSCGIHTIATACGYHPISALGAPITRDDLLGPGGVVMTGRGMCSSLRKGKNDSDNCPYGADMNGEMRDVVIDGKTKCDDEESGFFVSSAPSTPDKKEEKRAGAAGGDVDVRHLAREEKVRGAELPETAEMQALRRLGPPNLQLNHCRPQSWEAERQQKFLVLCIAAVAVVLQLGLVTIAGLTTHHEATRTAVGYDVKTYGFPCYAAGSLALCLGMAICSYIIGRSTVEWSWEPVESPDSAEPPSKPHLFWVQKAQSVNDQTFRPYAILEGKRLRVITSSRRNGDKQSSEKKRMDGAHGAPHSDLITRIIGSITNPWGAATVFGVLAAVAGFILQFIGLRALPYPVSFAQLGSILVMALLRAFIRNRTRRPLQGFETLPRYELDFLASRIAFNEDFSKTEPLSADAGKKRHNWRILTAGDKDGGRFPFPRINRAATSSTQASAPVTQEPNPKVGDSELRVSSQQLLRVRQRLGYVTTWQSVASSASLALSSSMVHFLSEFIKDPRSLNIPEQDGLPHFKKDGTICMNISLPATRTATQVEQTHSASLAKDEDWVTIRCFWYPTAIINGTASGTWEVEPASLDAVLSLWMAYVEETYPPKLQSSTNAAGWFDPGAATPTYRYRRILGNDFYNSGTLKRDLSWWVDSFSEQLLAPKETNAKLVIGFHGPETIIPNPGAELAMDSCLSLPLILAQHLFTSFIWSITKYLPRSCLGQGLPFHKQEVEVSRSRKFVPQHFRETWSEPALRQRSLTKVVQQIERTGLGDATDILLCIIPALSFADLLPNEAMLEILPQKTPDYGWVEVADCYDHLLQSNLGKSIEERFCYEVVVATVDFLVVVSEPYDDDTEPSDELRETLRRLAITLLSGYHQILGKLFMIYHLQSRFGDVITALNRFTSVEDFRSQFESNISNAIFSELNKQGEDPLSNLLWLDPWGTTSRDFSAHKLSFSPGHFEILKILAGDHRKGVQDDDVKLSRRLLDAYKTISGNTSEYDIFGWTPLHYTSLCREFSIVQKIYGVVHELDPNGGKRGILKLRDRWDRNPLHVAARDGCHDNLEELLSFAEDRRAMVLSPGRDGLTPLHLAVKKGSEECFKTLRLGLRGAPATQTDIWDREPLHIAANLARTTFCVSLLNCRGRAEPEREDSMGHTPLMLVLKNLNKERIKEEKNNATELQLQNVVAKILEQVQQTVNFKYENGGTLLHLIAKYGDIKIFFEKIKEAAAALDINGKDNDGRAPLHAAITARRESNALFILEKLRRYGKLDLATTETREGVSAAAMACEMGLDKVVEELLRQGACLTTENADGKLQLLLYSTVGTVQTDLEKQVHGMPYAKTVDLLLEKATMRDLTAGNVDGQTPLIAACISGFEYAVEKILDRAVDLASHDSEQDADNRLESLTPKEFRDMVNQRDIEYDQSALEYACERGKEKIAKILLEPRYIVTPEGAAGKWHRYTALHFAVGFARGSAPSWVCIAQLLCDSFPALLESRDEYGRTPLELSEDRDQEDLRRLILSHKSTRYWQKEVFLQKILKTPFDAHISWIPDIIRSLPVDDFTKLQEERDRIAHLADRESIGTWTDMVLSMDEDKRREVDIPCHFAVRGYTSDKVLSVIQDLKKHWELQQKGSSAEKLTRPDRLGAPRSELEVGPNPERPAQPPGEVGWSIVDWAKSFGFGEDVIASIRGEYANARGKLSGADLSVRRVEMTSSETRYMFDLSDTYRALGILTNVSYDVTKISIGRDISADLNNKNNVLCLRTTSPLPPDANQFSFDVKIIKWPPSGTLMIGFCGEFFPKEEDLDCPGKFYNSLGFEDRGRLYVDEDWDLIPSDRVVSSSFEQGDTITVFLDPPPPSVAPPSSEDPPLGIPRRTWYSKKPKNSKTGVEFISEAKDTARLLSSDRFKKGKIYPKGAKA